MSGRGIVLRVCVTRLLLAREEGGTHVFAVQALDPVCGDLFGACGFTREGVTAVPEAFFVHLADHFEGTSCALGLSLRQDGVLANFGGGEEHGGGVFACGDARTTTDACCSVEGCGGVFASHQDGVGVGSVPCVDGVVSTLLLDTVERVTVDREVFDDGEGLGAEGLECERVTIFVAAHVHLADGGGFLGSVGLAVDHESTGSADAFAAVGFKGYRVFAFADQRFVEMVEHLEERFAGRDVVDVVGDKSTWRVGALLSPDFECNAESILICHYL